MKIAIPIENNTGLDSRVFAHFGSAPFFMILDADTAGYEVLNNADAHHQHGMCHPMSRLSTQGIDCVVCGGMGLRAVQKLNAAGIKAYRVSRANLTVRELMEEFKKSNLAEITAEDACRDHSCH